MKINLGKLTVTSPAFKHGERMPDDQSGNGAGMRSPCLNAGLVTVSLPRLIFIPRSFRRTNIYAYH